MNRHQPRSEPLPSFEKITDRTKYPNKPSSVADPNNEPTGPFTGRCKCCGSNDLWDDCTAYGCNNCGAVYSN